ncbi:MAG: hypothetical protein E4H14_04655 [Candidatus Thorarchaeota archaeon]|nr:MAG: hypothetical protein E4H14_04655 [Candidatus Thorarchaeota archaeon]
MNLNQTKLLAIVLVAIMVSGGAMAALVLMQPQNNSSEQTIEIVGIGTSQNVTLSDMVEMTAVTGNSSYQNTYGNIRGAGIYTGVRVSDLVDLVGGMGENDSLRIIADDDYSQSFERYKVYPNSTYLDIQGEMILAYEYNGSRVPEYEEGFRLAFIPADGYYSNADANETTDPNPVAAGPQWVSNVVRIEVMLDLFTETRVVNETYLRTLPSITGEGGYKKTSGEIVGPFNFTGVAFSVLLQEFSSIPDNYIITSLSGDGWMSEYTKDVVNGLVSGYSSNGSPLDLINSTMVIAYEENGTAITDGGPLKIVFINQDGNLTDGFRWAKDVVSITIMEQSAAPLILSMYILSHTEYCAVNDAYITDQEWY